MSNNDINNEAKRITKILIDINKSDDDLEKLVNKLINKQFKKNIMDIMIYIPNMLAENKYYIENISPFELKKYNL